MDPNLVILSKEVYEGDKNAEMELKQELEVYLELTFESFIKSSYRKMFVKEISSCLIECAKKFNIDKEHKLKFIMTTISIQLFSQKSKDVFR